MIIAQRALLATSCLVFLVFLKYMFDQTATTAIVSYLEQLALANGHSSNSTLAIDPAPIKQSGIDSSQLAVPIISDNPQHNSPFCQRLRDAGLPDLAVILRTGSTEIYEKLPIHLSTSFACLTADRDYLVYSDVAQSFGSFKTLDALALVSNETRAELEDFVEYERLKEHVRLGGDAADLKGQKAWDLDKWKFLPMISDAYSALHERKKWFFFVEADTYTSISNMLLWLSHLDANRPIYAGAQVLIGETEFGHGGSGVLLSAPAAKAFRETYLRDRRRWEQVVDTNCCGDKVVAEVLMAAEPPIHLLRSFPLIQGETLSSLDWSPTHWCKPAVTWHHVNAAGNDRLWQHDREIQQGGLKPILFRDYFDTFIFPQLRAANYTIQGWDNLSSDFSFSASSPPAEPEAEYNIAAETAWACKSFCEKMPECVQWAFRKGSCKANKVIRLGWDHRRRPGLGSAEDRIQAVNQGDLEGAVSGWLKGRIEQYIEGMGECDEGGFWTVEND